MKKILKGLMTFFMCMGGVVVSGLVFNHIHWAAGLAVAGGFVFCLIQYRHYLFPDLPK
jgi:hypothetical protein